MAAGTRLELILPIGDERIADTPPCWCGNATPAPYSPDYARCTSCGSLVLRNPPTGTTHVVDETTSFYGLRYFDEHARELGFPTLADRARLDLPERCTFWLRTLLDRCAPPARTLEIGSANGAFVGLLAEAGYQATGLDLSPAVTARAREAFQVPVLTGPIEEQGFEPSTFDVIAMMDVLEHLPDPVGTLRSCASALSPVGILYAQTPRFDPSPSYEDLRTREDPFFVQFLKTRLDEHLFVLSESAVRQLLARVGFEHVEFVPAIFAQYDMSFVASRAPIPAVSENEWRTALRRSRSGRIVEALLDAGMRNLTEIPSLYRQVTDVDRARAAVQQRLDESTRELEGVRMTARVRVEELSARVDEMGSRIARLREVQDEYHQVVRRLGILAKLFGARRTVA